jgi:tetratricopeptide (TPR) repeat protein
MRPRYRHSPTFHLASLLALFLITPQAFPRQPQPADAARESARLNNLGCALMGQQQLEAAAAKFGAAYQRSPSLTVARLNQGIAFFYLQRLPEAEEALLQAAAKNPKDPHSWYALGLLFHTRNQRADAEEAFRKVLALDPADADTLYEVGLLNMEAGQLAGAVASFQQEPLHASSNFGLARALQREGKSDEAKAALASFQHILAAKLGFPMSHVYGEEGKYSRVEDASLSVTAVGPMIPVVFSPHPVPSPSVAVNPGTQAGGGACLIDLGDKTRPALIVLGEGEHAINLYRNNAAATLELIPEQKTGLDASGKAVACAAGDYDNDGLSDLAVAMQDRMILFHNLGGGRFEDVMKASGITSRPGVTSLLFVDFDHDGDLDLFASGSPFDGYGPNTLWRNNGNKTFTEWTKETGLTGTGATTAATLSDLNNDRAIDLLVAGSTGSPTFYANRREGAFDGMPLFADSLSPSTSVATFDFNKDGWMDVVLTHAGSPGVSLWRNVDGKSFEREPLPLPPLASAIKAVPIDFDNDGWIDLAILVEGPGGPQIRMVRNLGPAGFADVTDKLQLNTLKLPGARSLLATDVDGDGAVDLIVTSSSGAVDILRNQGNNKHHSLAIKLQGLADNKSGVGTKIQVYANGLWQKWEDIGQPEIVVGLGDADKADLIRLLWPTGVPQDELDLASDKTHLVAELDRRGSSCPTLFAWNGSRYNFISDVIGAGVVGHWISPTDHNIPDPDEWIKIPGDQLKSRNGLYSLRFGEPMEEVNFMDQVRMVAIDHPTGTSVDPNESFLSEPPFAREKVVASATARPLAGAWDDHGKDALPELSKRDRTYVRDFTNLPFAGFANRHHLALDIGPWTPGRPLRLLLHGFIEYFSASSMYAAWQAGLKPEPPSLEAFSADGQWHKIIDDMGFPAGLPRTIVVDLTNKLPPGTTKLRITTNLQIYWDQILVDSEPATAVPIHQTELPLSRAQLGFRGYPEQRDLATPGDLSYDYQRASATGPFIAHRGAYTRYGDVTPLLRAVDDEYVVFGTGEDIDLEFRGSSLPRLPQGWTRDFFFYANGYVKDMDFYEATPFVVGEMPFHGMSTYPYPAKEHYPDDAAHTEYQLEWNTRFESGSPSPHYQLYYQPRAALPIVEAGQSKK